MSTTRKQIIDAVLKSLDKRGHIDKKGRIRFKEGEKLQVTLSNKDGNITDVTNKRQSSPRRGANFYYGYSEFRINADSLDGLLTQIENELLLHNARTFNIKLSEKLEDGILFGNGIKREERALKLIKFLIKDFKMLTQQMNLDNNDVKSQLLFFFQRLQWLLAANQETMWYLGEDSMLEQVRDEIKKGKLIPKQKHKLALKSLMKQKERTIVAPRIYQLQDFQEVYDLINKNHWKPQTAINKIFSERYNEEAGHDLESFKTRYYAAVREGKIKKV